VTTAAVVDAPVAALVARIAVLERRVARLMALLRLFLALHRLLRPSLSRLCTWLGLSAGCGGSASADGPAASYVYAEFGNVAQWFKKDSGKWETTEDVWWEERLDNSTVLKASSTGELAKKLGSDRKVEHTTGIINILAEKGWEVVDITEWATHSELYMSYSSSVFDTRRTQYRVLFRKRAG